MSDAPTPLSENESIYVEVCEVVGGPKELMRKLVDAGVQVASLQVVSNWRTSGIPADKAKAVERLTSISVRRLRPKDWHLYWPDAADNATQAATAAG